jgi:hypothetical protein
VTAPEAVPEVEEHALGGLTRAEALKIYDVGMSVAPSDEDRKLVAEIGRRVTAEIDLLNRAHDYGDVLEYVKETEGFITEPQGEELAYALENTLDRLERGDSETMEFFADWRKERKRRKKQKKRDLLLLAEATDARVDELHSEIKNGDLPRGDISRMRREVKELERVLSRAWAKVGL